MAETPAGTVDGTNAVFTASGNLLASHQLFVDRVLQVVGTDYTYSGATITFLAGSIPQAGALLLLYGTVPAAPGTGSPDWDTVADIVSDAAIELGLVVAPIADPYASTDQNIVQLRQLLKSQGRELVKVRAWTHLQKDFLLTTVPGQTSYPLPVDYRATEDQTGWNRTSALPMTGPVSPQAWAQLKALPMASAVTLMWRPLNGQVVVTPTPTQALTIAFEYLSSYWVRSLGAPAPDKDAPTAATDVVCFEPLLALRALKLAFLKAKKLECSSEQEEYDETLAAVAADDSPAEVLRLGRGKGGLKLLDWDNVPITGAGK